MKDTPSEILISIENALDDKCINNFLESEHLLPNKHQIHHLLQVCEGLGHTLEIICIFKPNMISFPSAYCTNCSTRFYYINYITLETSFHTLNYKWVRWSNTSGHVDIVSCKEAIMDEALE